MSRGLEIFKHILKLDSKAFGLVLPVCLNLQLCFVCFLQYRIYFLHLLYFFKPYFKILLCFIFTLNLDWIYYFFFFYLATTLYFFIVQHFGNILLKICNIDKDVWTWIGKSQAQCDAVFLSDTD